MESDHNNEDDENELKIIREFFDTVDLDCSGYIDETELAAVVDLPPDQIKEIFKKLDRDGDGKISIEQFTENYKHFQNYVEDPDEIRNNNDIGPLEQMTHENNNDNTSFGQSEHLSPNSKGTTKKAGYSMSEPLHRKNHPPIRSDIKSKAAKYLGQEYLDDLYEVARSRDDPMLLQSLENFLTATVESLLQKQADNEKLDTALRRATEKNTEIAVQLEEEMEHQVAALEEKIRNEERTKLEQQKQEAHAQLVNANEELQEMERKIINLEKKISYNSKKENENPSDQFIHQIRKKEQENQQLQQRLLEFQTQMSLMRTEVVAMKAEYDEQADRLKNERGTVLGCVQEQENLTRQLQMLHEANKKLHDTNDDLRSALDLKRSHSIMSTEPSPIKRSASCVHARPTFTDLQSSFRSDPGTFRNSTMNDDLNDTDEDSQQIFPHDDDEVNEQSLLNELMAAENKSYPSFKYDGLTVGAAIRNHKLEPSVLESSAAGESFVDTSSADPIADREQFMKQLEILSETNRRLGESNDELRNALSLLSEHVRSDQGSEMLSIRESPQGCYSAPVTPYKDRYDDDERPNSTSSPRKVLLTKSGFHSLSETRSMPDLTRSVPGLTSSILKKKKMRTPVTDDSLLKTVPMTTSEDFSEFCTACNWENRIHTEGVRLCDACIGNDTDAIVADISLDVESLPPVSSVSRRERPPDLDIDNDTDAILRDISMNDDKTLPVTSSVIGNSGPIESDKMQLEDETSLLSEELESDFTGTETTETLSSFSENQDIVKTPMKRSSEVLPIDNEKRVNNEKRVDNDKKQFIGIPKRRSSAEICDEEELIEPIQIQQSEHSLDDIFNTLKSLPPTACEMCGKTRQLNNEGIESCNTCTTFDFINRSMNQLPESTLLTESEESDSDNYSEQETSHFNLGKRAKPFQSESDDNVIGGSITHETSSITDISMTTTITHNNSLTSNRSKALLKNLKSEMSVYSRKRSEDEESDEDDMDDEELIRLVDQTNEDSNSLSEEPITVEEKILEGRGHAVGSSASESRSSVNTGHGEPEEMFKLVLAGNAAVGKSSFIIRLCKNKFFSALNSTLGVDFQMKTLEVDQKNVALQLWDTAGQERFRSIAKSYFRRVDGVILLYDVTCENSFLDVRDWIESIESSNNNGIPVIICGNKIDLRPRAIRIGMPVVTREQGRQLAKKVGALFIETSAKEGTNIHKACKDLIKMMQKVEYEEEKPNGLTLDNEPKKKKMGCC